MSASKSIEIRHRLTGAILFSGDYASLLECVQAAVRAGANLADADLAGANLAGANLADADLAGADLVGAYLARADLAGANLADADLAGADLVGANLAGANLVGANLADADLVGANLVGANLAGANLAGAYLAGARNVPAGVAATSPAEPYQRAVNPQDYAARAARFRANHPNVPVVESLDRKIVEAIDSGRGTLEMSHWHTCETTHCRAGWAIHLAGEAGHALEVQIGAARAGRMIYLASTGRAPHFYATNERAIEDLRKQAESQRGGADAEVKS